MIMMIQSIIMYLIIAIVNTKQGSVPACTIMKYGLEIIAIVNTKQPPAWRQLSLMNKYFTKVWYT